MSRRGRVKLEDGEDVLRDVKELRNLKEICETRNYGGKAILDFVRAKFKKNTRVRRFYENQYPEYRKKLSPVNKNFGSALDIAEIYSDDKERESGL